MEKGISESPLKAVPKLFFKKNAEEFLKKDREDKLTKEDLDDWIELWSSFTDFLCQKKKSETN